MSMTMIIIISLLVLNLSLTLIMFWILHSVLEAAKSLQDSEDILKKVLDLNNQLIEKYNKCLDNVYERETTIHDAVITLTDNITEAYNKMYEQYKLICETHTKLLECWKGCEERYSQSYEEFKHCSDQLKELSFQITDLANVSTGDEYSLTLNEACDTVCLDCPYKKCQTEVCPVYEIKHNNQPDIKFKEIPYDHSIIIHDFSNAAERSAEILNQKQEKEPTTQMVGGDS